jgi:hypothetical protein
MESKFYLDDEAAARVESGHRQMMKFSDSDPIRMSVFADQVFDDLAWMNDESLAVARMSLQPGATKQMNGKMYVLNQNHRWTLPKDGQATQSPSRSPGAQQKNAKQNGKPQSPASKAQDRRKSQMESRSDSKRYLQVDVEASTHGGVTDAARVGVPAFEVPPPPKHIPRIPNLQGAARQAEERFASKYEKDPEKCTKQALDLFRALSEAKGDTSITFGTDDVKALSTDWNSNELEENLSKRSYNRATLNTALHQTANAVTKRAFLKHLDTLPEGAEVMVTVGGCGAGKGFAMKKVPEAIRYKNRASAVWDSAGDQNATENPWILQECQKRGLTASFVYVHADPKQSWAGSYGVVKRAQDESDGRMVDARVFADSYAIGAKNHQKFYEQNKNNRSANFVFLQNGADIKRLPGIPRESLELDRHELYDFAVQTVIEDETIPEHIKIGALAGRGIWSD